MFLPRSGSSKGEWLALTRLVSLCVNSFLLGHSGTRFPVLERSVSLHIGSWVLCHASGMDSAKDQRLVFLYAWRLAPVLITLVPYNGRTVDRSATS